MTATNKPSSRPVSAGEIKPESPPLWASRAPILVDAKGREIRTQAQFLACHGHTDCRAVCSDFQDLAACCRHVKSCNEFEAQNVIDQLSKLNLRRYLSPGNPNNGREAFNWFFGWEYSPVIYCEAIFSAGLKVLTPSGDREYDLDQPTFKAMCAHLGRLALADENDESEGDQFSVTWRFWWD